MAVAVLALAGCSEGAEGIPLPLVQQPALTLLTPTPDRPGPAFARSEREYLLTIVRADTRISGWAAGCLWRKDVERPDMPTELTPFDLIPIRWRHVASARYRVLPGEGGEETIAGTVYATSYDGPPVTEFEVVKGGRYFCYRPKES